jgi:hypothetical protein
MAVVIIVGVGLLGAFLWNTLEGLLSKKPVEQVVTLSAYETRDAIDAEMPVLLDYLGVSAADAHAAFAEMGWNVVLPERDTSDNPDETATGGELVHLAPGVDTAILDDRYYASEFDGYNFDELQASFNGAWMLDLSQGDLGSFAQFKYVNFAADSLVDEFQHLRELQGLFDDRSIVIVDGVDGYGNSYARGYTVIDDVTYYWTIVGIAFGDYYGGQDKRSLPETAVFVRLKLADFDFYGAQGLLSGETE